MSTYSGNDRNVQSKSFKFRIRITSGDSMFTPNIFLLWDVDSYKRLLTLKGTVLVKVPKVHFESVELAKSLKEKLRM